MKRKLFFMSMFSLSLMLGACGNKEEKSANDAAGGNSGAAGGNPDNP